MSEYHVVEKFKKLWIETFQREREDNNTEIILNIASSSQQGVLSICIDDNDRKLPSNGDMTIFDYDFDKKEAIHLKQDEFIVRYCDGNHNVGQTVLNLLKIRLNNADRDAFANEWMDKFKKDGDKRYFVLISDKSKFYIVIGININKQYVEDIINKDLDPYVDVKIEEDDYRFQVISPEYSYPEFEIKNIKKQDEEYGKEICKTFLEEIKKHKQKIGYPSNLKYGMSLYKDYSDYIDNYNKQASELKKDILEFTNNGTKIKKRNFRTEEDNRILTELQNRCSKLEKLASDNTYNNKSKYLKYKTMLKEMERITKDMKNWSDTTTFKGRTCDLTVDFSDISDMTLQGKQFTFIKGQDDIEKLKDFIELGRKVNDNKFYVTYKDEFGNTSVDKARLFYKNGVAEFRKGSSKSGHYIDNNWIRIDYFKR